MAPPGLRGPTTRVGLAGAAIMGVTFGMARYAYGLTLPDVRAALGVPDPVLGLIASGAFAGFLVALLLAGPVSARWGPRAATTVGGVSGTVGAALVAGAASPPVLAVGALCAGSAAGWVWAPYSDVVAAVAPADARPRLLAWITTGAGAGLVLVGPLDLVAVTWASWRWTWVGIAVVAAGATALNLRWVPRVPARARERRWVPGRAMIRPLVAAVVLFAAATAYVTYATDAARRGGLGVVAGPAVFVVVGATGMVALATGRWSTRVGPGRVAAGALTTLAAAVAVLALGAHSLVAVLGSAVLAGVGNTVGSAALPIWTAQLAPDRPASAFTAALLVGSLTAVAVPALIGALSPHVGLTAALLGVAAVTIVGAAHM